MIKDFPSLKDVEQYLPKYLSGEDQKKLFAELASYPANIDKRLFSEALKSEAFLLQGDGISVVKYPPQEEGDSFQDIKALILSNTCDISTENKRPYEAYCTFAPIFSLEKYKGALKDDGHSDEAIANHIKAIKEQKITPFFYIPKVGELGECFARFDLVFSSFIDDDIVKNLVDKRIFSLSNYGFYLLLFKYSIHTNRIQERVHRD